MADWAAMVGSIAELGSSITVAVDNGLQRTFLTEQLSTQWAMQNDAAQNDINLANEQTRLNIRLQTAAAEILKFNTDTADASRLKNWKNDPNLGVTCAAQYDASGQLPPTCLSAGFTVENIALKREADRKTKLKIGVVVVAISLATLFFIMKIKKQ